MEKSTPNRKEADIMGKPRIEIKTKEGTNGVFTEVYVDGNKLRGVRSWCLKHDGYNTVPTLTVDLNALDLCVDGEFLLMQKGYEEIDVRFKDSGEA